MSLQQLDCDSGLMSFVVKSISLSAGVAILLASSRALAFNNQQFSVTSQDHLSSPTPLARNVKVAAEPEESESNIENRNEPRFTCQFLNGQYTVMYHPESQPGQAYSWATPSTLGGGWTPELRCNEISRRLELYRPDGLLEMQTSVENNYNIICVTTQKDSTCRIVLTVPPGQDAELTRDRVFENLTVADAGQDTDAVTTFVGEGKDSQLLNQILNQGLSAVGIGKNPLRSSGNINLRPFLDPADGGTGTQLQRGSQMRPNPRLNPDRFR